MNDIVDICDMVYYGDCLVENESRLLNELFEILSKVFNLARRDDNEGLCIYTGNYF